MMIISGEVITSTTLVVGRIYKFSAPEKIETGIPHYFIVIAIIEEGNKTYFLGCTSQRETKEKHFEKNRLDYSTLIVIPPGGDYPFTKETYIDCNETININKQDFISKCETGDMEVCCMLNLDHYFQIYDGVQKSKTVENRIKQVLISPDGYEKLLDD